MVNASLNWSSIIGIFLFVWGLIGGFLALPQVFFNLQRRADTSPAVIGKTLINIIQGLERLFLLPLCGGILFFQGWRLDPILQFGQFILALALFIESSTSIISDYQKWRRRTGRATAGIAVKTQPTDVVE
jgi:hypothetical protein